MRPSRLWLAAVLASVMVFLGTAPNAIRLRFEVYRNGTLVGSPELSVTSGTAAKVALDAVGTIAVTPAFRGTDSVALDFDINSGGRHLQPRLVLGANRPGSASWSSASRQDTFKFNVTWIP